MAISEYSIVMALLCATAAALLVSLAVRRASRYWVSVFGAVLGLALVRLLLPLDIPGALIIRSERIYPFVEDVMKMPIAGALTVGRCLLLLWAAGTVWCLVRLVWKLEARRRFCRAASRLEPDSGPLRLWPEVAAEYGYRGPATIVVSSKAATAYQMGYLRPCIVLPQGVEAEEDVRNMLRHELNHFLGRDLWIKLFLQVLWCLLWWDPAMPLLGRAVSQMLELRCDRAVCRGLDEERKLSYLDTMLLLLSRDASDTLGLSTGFLGSSTDDRDMVQRFQMILRGESRRSKAVPLAILAVSCALFAVSYLVLLQPYGDPPEFDERGNTVVLVSDDAYLLHKTDDTFYLYTGGTYIGPVPEVDQEPFDHLPIIEED